MVKFPCLVLVGPVCPTGNLDPDNDVILDVQKVEEGEITVKSVSVSIPITIGSDYLTVHFSRATGSLDEATMLHEFEGQSFDNLVNELDMVIHYDQLEFAHILYIYGKSDQFLELLVVDELPEKFALPTIDNFK